MSDNRFESEVLLPTEKTEEDFVFFRVLENTIIGIIDFILRYINTIVRITININNVVEAGHPKQYSNLVTRPFTFLAVSSTLNIVLFNNAAVDIDNLNKLALQLRDLSPFNVLSFAAPYVISVILQILLVTKIYYILSITEKRVLVYGSSYLIGYFSVLMLLMLFLLIILDKVFPLFGFGLVLFPLCIGLVMFLIPTYRLIAHLNPRRSPWLTLCIFPIYLSIIIWVITFSHLLATNIAGGSDILN